jgi:hypothetical protein
MDTERILVPGQWVTFSRHGVSYRGVIEKVRGLRTRRYYVYVPEAGRQFQVHAHEIGKVT